MKALLNKLIKLYEGAFQCLFRKFLKLFKESFKAFLIPRVHIEVQLNFDSIVLEPLIPKNSNFDNKLFEMSPSAEE